MSLQNLSNKFASEKIFKTKPRTYLNHSVEFKKPCDAEKRITMLEKVGLNVFYFPAEMITGCDFLSDSGTTTMTNEQWAALHMGDESYGSNRGYFELMKVIQDVFGKDFFNVPEMNSPNAFIFHQGRSCEDALFSMIGKWDSEMIIPSNGHFDTTEANIMVNQIKPINLFSKALTEGSESKFKGDIDTQKLRELVNNKKEKIPVIYLTITNNTGGGQPVSMSNIKEVASIAQTNNIPFFLDACRFAENAWFIQKHESGYAEKEIKEIVKEMFSYADGFTISFKKDGLVNMGGGLFIKNEGLMMSKHPELCNALMDHQICKEGHPTYGGLSGRDIMALVVGLKQITKQEYLDQRIEQVQYFGLKLKEAGIPVVWPVGGHAVYIDMNKFFEDTDLKANDFGGISFTALLLSLYGHRACELGNFAFGSVVNEEDKFPEVNYVRFAVPRLRYEKSDLDNVVEAVTELYNNRKSIPGVQIVYGRELSLRHFKARFAFKES